jgi:hypothetical protein
VPGRLQTVQDLGLAARPGRGVELSLAG